jgi:hypothetical protein
VRKRLWPKASCVSVSGARNLCLASADQSSDGAGDLGGNRTRAVSMLVRGAGGDTKSIAIYNGEDHIVGGSVESFSDTIVESHYNNLSADRHELPKTIAAHRHAWSRRNRAHDAIEAGRAQFALPGRSRFGFALAANRRRAGASSADLYSLSSLVTMSKIIPNKQ